LGVNVAKNFWDDDEEESTPSKSKSGKATPEKGGQQRTGSLGFSDSGEVDQKIHDTKVLMEQTHNLYQHYFNGIEKRPPMEKARLLESRVKELERMSATITAARYKISQFILQYKTFRDLWDRKLRDKEKI
jgi:hypothetical protein